MPKMLMVATLALVLLGLASTPAHVAAAKHRADGSGTSLVNGVEVGFAFEATGSPRKARGYAAFDLPNLGTLQGDVTCLKVDGDRATLSGRLDQPIQGYYTHFALVVVDNGPAQQPSLDTYWPFISAQRFDCRSFLEAPSRAPLVSGDILVR